jgi:WD40 repeat protein
VIDVATGKKVEPIAGRPILAIDGAGRRCVAGGEKVALYDLSTMEELCPLPTEPAICMFNNAGDRLARWNFDGDLEVWDAEQGKSLGQNTSSTDMLTCAVFSPDGRRLLALPGDGTLRVWDVTQFFEEIVVIRENVPAAVAATFDPQGRFLAIQEQKFVTVLNIAPIEE